MRPPRIRRLAMALCGALSLIALGPSVAQVALPTVRLPVPVDVKVAAPAVGYLAVDARSLRLRQLLRTHRDQLDTDPRGALIVRSEILAYAPTAAALQVALDAGFEVRRENVLEEIGVTIVVLLAPEGLSMRRALLRLRKLDPAGVYDFNHIYLESGAVEPTPESHPVTSVRGDDGIRVGLIDSGIAAAHPALATADIRAHGCDGAGVPTTHGTAVASLLLLATGAASDNRPRVRLYTADVYCGAPTGGAVDAVIAALAWMAREQVPVVNVSLVGPPNALLERVIASVAARGQTIVAAVGNDGPAAPPLYPAAYADVVAVTAVDGKRKVLLEAGRGRHVDFAAPGADLAAAASPDGWTPVRGTSYAAPIVAGLLARAIDHADRTAADDAIRTLAASALDLGARGPDPVYGRGLVGDSLPDAAVAAQRPR